MVVDTFSDEAMNGSDTSRSQYQAMLAAAARGALSCSWLICRVKPADAFESERVIRRLEFSGIRIVSISDGYDSTSKTRKVHRGLKD